MWVVPDHGHSTSVVAVGISHCGGKSFDMYGGTEGYVSLTVFNTIPSHICLTSGLLSAVLKCPCKLNLKCIEKENVLGGFESGPLNCEL